MTGVLPDWRITFQLPIGLPIPSGALSDLPNVSVGQDGWIERTGKQRDFVIGQAIRIVTRLRPFWRGSLLARLVRANQPSPMWSGPLRRGDNRVIEIMVSSRRSVSLTDGGSMRHLELAI